MRLRNEVAYCLSALVTRLMLVNGCTIDTLSFDVSGLVQICRLRLLLWPVGRLVGLNVARNGLRGVSE